MGCGSSFDTMAGVGLLEVAELSLDEPELQAVSFGLEIVSLEENEAPLQFSLYLKLHCCFVYGLVQ